SLGSSHSQLSSDSSTRSDSASSARMSFSPSRHKPGESSRRRHYEGRRNGSGANRHPETCLRLLQRAAYPSQHLLQTGISRISKIGDHRRDWYAVTAPAEDVLE